METIRKVKIHILFIFCLIIISAVCLEVFAETAPEEIMDAAKNGLHAFLQRIPQDNLENYGFTPKDPLAKAYVGIPFRVYTITPSDLLNW